jgi:hypothetical protein
MAERDIILATLHTLDPNLFANYTVSKGCVFPMRVLYKDLETYNKRLRHANYLLTHKVAVANAWCQYTWINSSLEELWSTSNKIRCDPVKTVAEFKSLALTFIDQYDLIKEAHIDTDGHNARMLATFRTSVVLLADNLLHFTLS